MAIRYIPFFPETIEGQAILNNFKRVLKYKGNDDINESLKRGMPLYEMKEIETVGEPSDNLVIRGECVSACAYLKSKGIKVDLVYIDPPFASGADYAKKIYIRRNPKIKDIMNSSEQKLNDSEFNAFEEKMYGDIWDKEKYLNWMYQNLLAIKSIMSENASIYVHLDWHIGHYVKILLDEIFGESNFRNEIIWWYLWGGRGKNQWNPKHDSIYFYSMSDDWVFNYMDVLDEHNLMTEGSKNRLNYKGAMVTTKSDSSDIPDDKVLPSDTWYVATINAMAKEKLDYSTQKPEELLERIIKASSNKNMVVADFFGGSGVAAKVSNDLGRKFIHCDVGINSIQTTRDRLVANNASFKVMEINDGITLYRNPVQTMDKLKSIIPGLTNASNLSDFWSGCVLDTKFGEIPVYLPDLVDTSPKIIDKVFMNRLLYEALPDLPDRVKKVIIYFVDMIDENEINSIIKKENYTLVNIEFKDLKEMLDDIVINDYVEYSLCSSNETLLETYNLKIEKFISDRVNRKIDEFNHNAFLNSTEKKPYNPIIISDEGLELIEYVSLDCTNKEGTWYSDEEIKIDKFGYVIHNGVKTKEFWNGSIQSERKPLRLKIRNICGDESITNI